MADIWENTYKNKTTYPPELKGMTIYAMSDNCSVSVNSFASLNGINLSETKPNVFAFFVWSAGGFLFSRRYYFICLLSQIKHC